MSDPETAAATSSNPKITAGQRPLPVAFGCSETRLTDAEFEFFKSANPLGFILFARNCQTPDQVRRLAHDLRQSVGRSDAPILIDQEGGRVSRLKAPSWHQYPAARFFGTIYEKDPEAGMTAMQLYARLVAYELRRMGITVNCVPVLDLFIDGASSAIGDRAISRDPAVVTALGRVLAETFLENGIMPVMKHLPGHGRLNVDPHMVLPIIKTSRAELEREDFLPFQQLKDLPAGMNSHAIFTELDPDLPASLSPTIHQQVIRGTIGFGGVIFSDDIVMKALRGTPAERAQAALAAGVDIVLHCNGDMQEMEPIAAGLKPMNDESWARWEHAKSMVKSPKHPYNPAQDSDQLDVLLGGLAFREKSAV